MEARVTERRAKEVRVRGARVAGLRAKVVVVLVAVAIFRSLFLAWTTGLQMTPSKRTSQVPVRSRLLMFLWIGRLESPRVSRKLRSHRKCRKEGQSMNGTDLTSMARESMCASSVVAKETEAKENEVRVKEARATVARVAT